MVCGVSVTTESDLDTSLIMVVAWNSVYDLLPKQTQESCLVFPIPILAKKTAVIYVLFLLAVCRMTNQ